MISSCLILCGGLGTRLREVISDKPKSLASVRGGPFLDLLINCLCSQGIKHFYFAAGHLSQQIQTYVSSLAYDHISTCVIIEKSPLGTGGAIANSIDHIDPAGFLIVNGDSFCDIDIVK